MGKHVVVIGGGIIGLCTAFYVARRGHHVTVLERGPEDHDCCSIGNMGFIAPSHFVPLSSPGMVKLGLKWMWNPESPFYIKPRLNGGFLEWAWKFNRAATRFHVERASPVLCDLNLASRYCYRELAGELENIFGFVHRGLLLLCSTPTRLDEEAQLAHKAGVLGLKTEVLTSAQTAEREPDVRMNIAGSVLYHDDAHLSPNALITALAGLVRNEGTDIRWNHEVSEWHTVNGTIIAARTNRGDVSADEFVLCGGAWSPNLVRELGLKIPMQAGKGYSLTLSQPRMKPSIPCILAEARVAVSPIGDTLRVGGTMEIAGMREGINPPRIRGIIKSFLRYFPDYSEEDFRGIEPWYGFRPCSPDGVPYLGRFLQYRNLSVATGHAMMGLSLGPITGKLMAELLSGEEPSMDITLLDPNRYG